MIAEKHSPVLVADGDIPTTHIVARLVEEAFGSVEVVYSAALQRAQLSGRKIIISRMCLPELSWLPAYLKQRGIGYSYFLDDNFYELDVSYDAHHGAFFGHPAVRATLDKFIDGADGVLVMSPTLATYLQTRFPTQQVSLIAPPIDLELFERHALLPVAMSTRKLRVGYPSTRRPNVANLLTDVVKRALELHGETVEFEFIGWMPEGLRDVPGVILLPEVKGYEKYVSTVHQRRWDVALAPLMSSIFENCKTNLKYREYAAFGIAGIYSDVPLYSSCVRDGQTGRLVKNSADAWLMALDQLLSDAALRAAIVHAARADVAQNYAQPLVAQQLLRCLNNVVLTHHG